MTTTPDIISDAALVDKFVEKMSQEPAVVVTTQAPADTTVMLSGALVEDGISVTTAEVRELNGSDEEALAKANTPGKSLSIALQRGLVSIGDRPVNTTDYDSLLSGDRDAILLGVRIVTFGKDVSLMAWCQTCVKAVPLTVDLSTDVPVLPFNGEHNWNVDTKLGVVTLGLPTGSVQKKLQEASDKTSAELGTLLLSGCIMQLDGFPVVASRIALNLGIMDRERILTDIIERSPGPRLAEVKKVCKTCGDEVPTPLSLADLFRI